MLLTSFPRIAAIVWICLLADVARGEPVRHYVFFARDRERISDASFLDTKAFEGAQLKYTWRELEPEKDRYEFDPIRHDLALLTSHGKKLFVQLQDVSFDVKIVNVPRYLTEHAQFNGGADKQFRIDGDDEASAVPEGWVARRWDPGVRERFHKLLFALGKDFDGKIEGINLPETAVSFGETGRLFPKGFTPQAYRDAVVLNMEALRRAFPKSLAMQYANFMPGEWLPGDDKSYLRSVYARAKDLKMAVGAPDLLPFRPGQMNHAYRMMHEFRADVPIGIAVQWGNYEHKNPKTGTQMSVSELTAFATDHLGVDYMFWCTQEPFYSEQVVTHLRSGR